MVIDDRYSLDGLQNLRIIHKIRPVGVHHNQQRIGICDENGVVWLDERFLIFLQRRQLINQVLGGGTIAIDNEIRLFAAFAHSGADARRRAYGVQIGQLMAHDEDIRGILDILPQRVGHHSGFDFGPFFHFLGLAAIKLKRVFRFNDHLVAAASQCRVCRQPSILI